MQIRKSHLQSALLGGGVVVAAIAAAAAAFLFLDSGRPLADLGDEYRYDLAKYAAIDPALVLYEPVGQPIPTGLSQSRTIAVAPDGAIWLTGDKTIVTMDSQRGAVFRTIECDAAPLCLAFGKDGLLYAGLTDHITVFDADGRVVAKWDKPTDNTLMTSLAVAGNDIFSADAANKVVWRWRKDGTLIGDIGRKDPDRNLPGFIIPSPYFDVAIAPDGLLRIVNPGRHWIEAWTIDGHREWHWGETSFRIEGFSGCCNPVNIAILPNGNFIACEKGLVRVKEYDTEGNFIGVVAGPQQLEWTGPFQICLKPEDCQTKGFDVAVDVDGRVYVLDTVRNVIRIFEKKTSPQIYTD